MVKELNLYEIHLPAQMKNILVLTLIVILAGFVVGFYYIYSRVENLSGSIEAINQTDDMVTGNVTDTDITSGQTNDECGIKCQMEIERIVSQAVATLSGTKVVTSTATSSPKTSYISIGTSYSTTSTDWVSIDDTKVYIDLESDYGKDVKVSWEASLKVAHGNGKAIARLYDDTNKIAVDFSEISTENNVTLKQVQSGNLPFWRGRNLYLVQIKSLNSFEVTYTGGRIKISY
jgi:hypothetical protein